MFSVVSVRIILFLRFLPLLFLRPDLRKGLTISGDTFINPANVSSAMMFLAGSVSRLQVLSVT